MNQMLRVDNESLNEELRRATTLDPSWESLIQNNNNEIKNLKQQLVAATMTIDMHKKEKEFNAQHNENSFDKEMTIKTLRNETESLKNEIKVMKYSFSERENEYKNKIESLKQEIEECKNETRNLYKKDIEIKNFADKLKDKESEIKEIKDKYHKKLINMEKKSKEKSNEWNRMTEAIKNQLDDLQFECEATQKTNNDLKNRIEKLNIQQAEYSKAVINILIDRKKLRQE